MTPRSLASVLMLYQQDLLAHELTFETAGATYCDTVRSFLYYTLPGWGGPIPKKEQPQPDEIEAAWQFMESIPLFKLQNALAVQEKVFQQLDVSYSCEAKYRLKLRQLLQWAQHQEWWPYPVLPEPFKNLGTRNLAARYRHEHGAVGSESVSGRVGLPPYSLLKRNTLTKLQPQAARNLAARYRHEHGAVGSEPVMKRDTPAKPQTARNLAPRYRHGHGAVGSESVSRRMGLPPYSLLKGDTPAKLQQQLDELYKFFTAAHQPKRPTRAIKPDVAKNYINYIRQALGWFYRYARPVYDDQGRLFALSQDEQVPLVPVEELSLDLLIPQVAVGNRNSDHFLEQAIEYVDAWICHLLNFLETERHHNSQSSYSVLTGIHALARFQYFQETPDLEYRDIPIVRLIRRHQAELNRRMKTEVAASDLDMQWLELPEVLERIVKPLREECAFRTSTGHLRPITAIAQSFQLFLIWACLTFRPPRRQQEFRKLQIGLACPIEKPKNLKKGQFIHPLPADRHEHKLNGYLYKDQDGVWYMDMTPESYKTGAKYGHQKLEIPNTPLKDGKSLYDYLEAFLYGYYRDPKGNWQSGGQLAETPATEGRWYSLRMAFEPTHNHVFGQPRAGGVLDHSQFCKLIRTSANRLTGQRVFPHLLRDIVATWFLINQYTVENIQSLAYAMGHSEAMLRKLYDRRTTQQKNQAIEDALSPIVRKFIA